MCVWVCTMYLASEYDMKYFLHLNLLVLYLYKCLLSSLMVSSCLNCPRTLPPVAFSKWLFSLSIVLAGFLLPFSHGCLLLTRVFVVTQRTISFYCWILFHQVDELRPVFSPSPTRASCLPPVLYNYEQSCYKHSYAGFLGGHKFSTQLGKHWGAWLMDHMLRLYLAL